MKCCGSDQGNGKKEEKCFLTRWIEKIDQKMKEKSKASCCSDKDKKSGSGSCCR